MPWRLFNQYLLTWTLTLQLVCHNLYLINDFYLKAWMSWRLLNQWTLTLQLVCHDFYSINGFDLKAWMSWPLLNQWTLTLHFARHDLFNQWPLTLQLACQDDDEEEDEDEQEAEFDGMLIESAGDVLPVMAKIMGGQNFMPFFCHFLTDLLKRLVCMGYVP